ncbi:hypothetical protein NC653_040054 [Populus alba x Populus x berolinensis]|uniref:Uncharacterized protein n=1 Tax=Populus alba x Populus x berolinensis TaxID=444605 RepID=A0AAD6PSV5_9ROSI|nr:hypothetical protein NC653_040041 [Populus alba x Populus x berolinensis]KAJ6958288.1 hypothetical protein NC653_040054 [Populus alba x Populus x berolinensis]
MGLVLDDYLYQESSSARDLPFKWSYSLLKESDLRSKNMYPGKTKHLFLTVSLKLNLNCSKQIQEYYLHASSIFADASSVAAECTHDMHEVRSKSQTVNQRAKAVSWQLKADGVTVKTGLTRSV